MLLRIEMVYRTAGMSRPRLRNAVGITSKPNYIRLKLDSADQAKDEESSIQVTRRVNAEGTMQKPIQAQEK